MANHAHTTPVRRPEGASNAGGRRSLFAGAFALACAPTIALAGPNPDAELIAASADYIAALDAWNGCRCGVQECPHERRYNVAQDRLNDAPDAETMAGVVAMAEVARSEAWQRDGTYDYGEAYTGPWPASVILAVLRIAGGAA